MSDTRTFHSSDYRRTASVIQGMRHVKGNRYQAKDQAHQAKIDVVAAYLAGVFADDATLAGEGYAFSNQLFLAGTQLPEVPEPHMVGNMIVGTGPGEFGYAGSVLLDSPDGDE